MLNINLYIFSLVLNNLFYIQYNTNINIIYNIIYMVQSKLDPSVTYNDNIQINSEDFGHESSQYEMQIFDRMIIIILGKPKYTYNKKNIIYYPIYTIENNKIIGQIGVFEIHSDNVLRYLDEDNELDISRIGQPLLYNFVDLQFLEKLFEKKKIYESEKLLVNDEDNIEKQKLKLHEDKANDEIESDDDEQDVIKLQTKPEILKHSEIIKKNKDNLFEINSNITIPKPLEEETETDSKEIKKKYTESRNNNWLQKFFNNSEFDIIDNEGRGDCLFAVIRDAYSQIGYNISVKKLRELLAENTTDDQFKTSREIYLNIMDNIKNNEKEMSDIKNVIKVLEKRAKESKNRAQKEEIINEARRKEQKYNDLREENLSSQVFIEEEHLDRIKNINNFDEYKEHIKTSSYWAGDWDISKLEELLNMKMIILSQNAFNENALDNVLQCGSVVNTDIQSKGVYIPTFYIMTSFTGNHYQLISYKRKQIFTYREIPYDIKVLITNKCMERNSGIFYMIQDFKNFKSKLGLNPEEGKPEEDELDYTEKDLYDPNIVFMFHSNSENKPLPGRGSNETIPDNKLIDFEELYKKSKKDTFKWNEQWRRKLDDAFIDAPFTIDNMKWNSVEHYLQGSKFKKGYPDFYKMFSNESNSDLSKDVALAKAAGSITGKLKSKIIRPKDITIDNDYDVRSNEERILALTSKFTQNPNMKKLLEYTYPAKLIHFKRGSPANPDIELMRIRKEIMTT